MNAKGKEAIVGFIDEKLSDAYEELKEGRFEDRAFFNALLNAIDEMKKNPEVGIPVPSALWPKIYIQKYGINNLRKYDLQPGWRLVYTIKSSEINIIAVLLEWFDSHKKYEKRFGYKKK